MIKLHHLEYSRSHRILWLLEELGLPYEIVRYQRDPKTLLAPPALKAIHPLGKSPVVEDGGELLAESGAILELLAERHGEGRLSVAPTSTDRARYLYWLHYAEGTMMPLFLMKLVFGRIPSQTPFLVRGVAGAISKAVQTSFLDPQIKTNLGWCEAELNRRPWFAGETFTAADIQMSYPLQAGAARAGLKGLPAIEGFLKRCAERPAYQRALAAGGPVELPI
jgi:glutathione S-transferase